MFEKTKNRADQGTATAQNILGIMHTHGIGVERDHQAAVSYYQQAAQQGFAPAQYNLASCYKMGTGVGKNPVNMLIYLELAANQGYSYAQHDFGLLWQGTDEQKVLRYLRLAANQGLLCSQKTLSLMYEKGVSSGKNHALSYKYLKAAADQEDPEAQFGLAVLYLYGNAHIQPDTVKAWTYMRASADQNFSFAQETLGFAHLKGNDQIQQCIKTARTYLELAAHQGRSKAQVKLAWLCESSGDPLVAINFAHMAIINPQSKKEDRDLILESFIPRLIASNFTRNNNTPQLGASITDYIDLKPRVLETVSKLQTAAKARSAVPSSITQEEEINFLNKMETAIKNVHDPLEDVLPNTTPSRNRVISKKDKEENL